MRIVDYNLIDLRGTPMARSFRMLIVSLILSPLLPGNAISQSSATAPVRIEESLAKLLKEIRPQSTEDIFDTIPWQVSLWDARVRAAKEGKPILIWEMDGHPLGCG